MKGSLNNCTTYPTKAGVVPVATRRRTGERRTDLQSRSHAGIRPREAVAQESDRTTAYQEETGAQRGQTSMVGTQLPLLALFASSSGARKKVQHKQRATKEQTASNADVPLRQALSG